MTTPHPVTFATLVLPNEPWPDLVSRWRRLEAGGIDTIWSCDHFTNPWVVGQRWFEGWTVLAALATATERVKIGLLVGAIVSRTPNMYVKQAQTVDHVTGGRLLLGLGAGGAPSDQGMWGVEDWSDRERAERFAEYVDLVDMLARADEATFEGRWYRTESAPMAPGFVQRPRPPLVLAAHGARTLKVVARHADMWNTFGPSLEEAREMSDQLSTLCGQIGRDDSDIGRSVLLGIRAETSWSSPAEFEQLVSDWHDAGFSDFIFYDPPVARAGEPVATPQAVDEVLASSIPRLRLAFG